MIEFKENKKELKIPMQDKIEEYKIKLWAYMEQNQRNNRLYNGG